MHAEEEKRLIKKIVLCKIETPKNVDGRVKGNQSQTDRPS